MRILHLPVVVALLVSATFAPAQADSRSSPFAPPRAKVHYAPDRNFDLKHLAVAIQVDYEGRTITGTAVNELVPLHDGILQIRLHAAAELAISGVEVGGAPAKFTHAGAQLSIERGGLTRGQPVTVKIDYSSNKAQGGTFGQQGGWHWIDSKNDSSRVGFWTQGETDGNHHWVPTWDYPNDFTTTETTTTVPAGWDVIGNGTLTSTTTSDDGKTRTFTWKMTQPHATYLLSLCGGPFDVKKDEWRGVPLLYVVPKGKGHMIDDSFGDTGDMLSFFSDRLGVKYPWPKYAQNAMYDFGGGMENVSSTTLGERSLADARGGFRTMASLNAHELAHQWFGDYVTCRDWGHIWLNESFATFMQALYFEHSRGKDAYDAQIESNMQAYFNESRRYQRPIATNLYPNPDAMFDSHTYPKGSVVLHTLRRKIGDQRFFAGLERYLTTHAHQPVVSDDLCQAMSEASGVNCEPFWNQWIYKPGHPVIDASWTWDDAAGEVVLTVKQTQDTRGGAPIYDVDTSVGFAANGKLETESVRLTEAEHRFRFKRAAKPAAVLFDPDHVFLREIRKRNWLPEELPHILALAPCAVDRKAALALLTGGMPTDAAVMAAVAALRADRGAVPALDIPESLGELKREDLRPFFREEMGHPGFARRAAAIRAIGKLAPDASDSARLRELVNERSPFDVVAAAVDALTSWDPVANADVLEKALALPTLSERAKASAFGALVRAKSDKGLEIVARAASKERPAPERRAALQALAGAADSRPVISEAITAALADDDTSVVAAAVRAAGQRKDKNLVPALKKLQEKKLSGRLKNSVEEALKQIEE
jgi:aminopeptidase N